MTIILSACKYQIRSKKEITKPPNIVRARKFQRLSLPPNLHLSLHLSLRHLNPQVQRPLRLPRQLLEIHSLVSR